MSYEENSLRELNKKKRSPISRLELETWCEEKFGLTLEQINQQVVEGLRRQTLKLLSQRSRRQSHYKRIK